MSREKGRWKIEQLLALVVVVVVVHFGGQLLQCRVLKTEFSKIEALRETPTE